MPGLRVRHSPFSQEIFVRLSPGGAGVELLWVMLDPRAAEAYMKYASDLVAYATVLAGPNHAEDVVAEAMVRVFSSDNWSSIREPRAYLYRSVFHEAQRRSKRSRLGELKERLAWSQRASDPVEQDGAVGYFRHLSRRERACIYLAYWEDLAIADIAKELDISDGSVRQYLARGRAKIREELNND